MAEAILVKGNYSESNTKTLLFNDVPISVSSWVEDTSSTKSDEFPYIGTVNCKGMTENYIPEVVFNLTDAISGNFSPICSSYTDKIFIWAKKIPETEIIISTIKGTLQV